MISNKVSNQSAEIKIEHEKCSDPNLCRDKEIFIESNSSDNNTLTTLTFNDRLKIFVFWESFSSAEFFDVLYVPETEVLFLGCGSISARVSTIASKLIGLEHVCLFWALTRQNNYVLETGELDCFLYTLDGKKVSSTAVDPPYEMEVTDQGIKFTSIVVGTTWLRYD
ncbi:hypothetical protein [Alkalimarinus alittae]|uniref:Uncharacterized protein n=1 Tax=Alkalimarinus alittae TaxID=2961619 RepID=A0ABY6N5D4_9ALTE|nr:hypothetical protein [Alkalimarinus alittae]UZE97192.1 hypothetical protein NKI27_05440 [Alkalimarinus alittae]